MEDMNKGSKDDNALTIKQLAQYPTGLLLLQDLSEYHPSHGYKQGETRIVKFCGFRNCDYPVVHYNIDEKSGGNTYLKEFKLILRPLDLKKEIVHNGKKIVPIMELAKKYFEIQNNCYPCGLEYTEDDIVYGGKLKGVYNVSIKKYVKASTIAFTNRFFIFPTYSLELAEHWIVKQLLEWGFDIDELIEKGLAVDIYSLNL